jgi:deoxycytidylate deaminase
MCSKAIVNAGIKRVIYKDEYRDKRGIELLENCGIDVLRLKK